MKKYYFLRRFSNPGDVYINKSNAPGFVSENYDVGASFNSMSETYQYFHKGKKITDLVAGIQSELIVSRALKLTLLQWEKENLEFFPIELINQESNERSNDYYIMNILNNVECLDRNKSKFELFHPDLDIITKITRLVLNKNEITDSRHIFRLDELPNIIIVSDELKTEIEKKEHSGLVLLPTIKYKPY